MIRRAIPWLLATLLVAAAVHVGAVFATPTIVNHSWFARLKNEGPRINVLGNARRAKPAGQDIVGYDNPDNVSSFMLFDVSETPVRLHLRVVREAAYWSVSFVADDTNVFRLIRDNDVSADALDIVLVGPHATYQPRPSEQIVRAPTQRGMVLVRMIVPDRSDAESVARLAAIKNESRSEVVEAP